MIWPWLLSRPAGLSVEATEDDTFGFEIDLWAEYRYSDAMTFSAGIAMILPDDQIDGSVATVYGNPNFDGDTSFLFWMQARLFF